MKTIQVYQFGGPEVLAVHEVPTPKPGPGEVLVRVRAAGVNPYDTYMRNGAYPVKPSLPYTPGSDAAGTIEAVGGGVTKVKPGDRVYTATTLTGAYAEYALARENQVYPLPEKFRSHKARGCGCPTEQPIRHCATTPMRAPAKRSWSTAPAVESASPQCSGRALWA